MINTMCLSTLAIIEQLLPEKLGHGYVLFAYFCSSSNAKRHCFKKRHTVLIRNWSLPLPEPEETKRFDVRENNIVKKPRPLELSCTQITPMRKYPVKYKDKFGEEKTEISSDGSTMYLTLRGIQFEGADFEMLEGKIDDNKFEYEKYQDGSGDLTGFELEVNFPIKIIWNNTDNLENLTASVTTGKENGSNVFLELKTKFGKFRNTKNYGWFEDALIEIQKMLPEKYQIKVCLSCKYSNYHPAGNGMFGGLHCFKNLKLEADNICNKNDLTDLWEKGYKEKATFNVTEVFDCSEHKFVTKDDWTYKDWI